MSRLEYKDIVPEVYGGHPRITYYKPLSYSHGAGSGPEECNKCYICILLREIRRRDRKEVGR